ncbi:AcrR family transcriptional regulator [Azospirillum agricola]|uniref:TetR/AcrR family transcriptional regulator n=1 Tax=Azospirillum agricola TaxID=1720247 RepID=UPI001AE752BB|nr:TetR/AcrR family transcriptional regulator [Azospirillum agricola]MBP2229214.1 AcrR family transcriptional regulator [Azospirillum agricola]
MAERKKAEQPGRGANEGANEGVKPAERIVEAARRLFCRDGIHATGIDRILAEAGTAKMTLYNQFGSKEGLIETVLRRESDDWCAWFAGALGAAGPTPRERLDGVFPALRDWFERGDYTGCAIMNAVAEYPKGDPAIRAIAMEHKGKVGALLKGIIVQTGCRRPDALLGEMAILIDGAIIAALIAGDPAAADAAGRIARLVIADHCDHRS